MKKYFFFIFYIIGFGVNGRDPKIDESMKKLVESFGYPFQAHEVITQDNYRLGLHRIPVSQNATENNDLPPVLLMHGLLGASPDWVVTGPNRSLAFLLSDNGFDVWIGNNRGNTYSKEHKNLNVRNYKFWDFSYHELGIYDAPAIIDFILNTTNHAKIFYIGFSQGCTQFYVMTSMKPEYNDKIILMSSLAPAAYTEHIDGLLKFISPLTRLGRMASEWMFYFEIIPHSLWFTQITDRICREGSRFQNLCEMMIFLIAGNSENNIFDKEHLAEFLRYAPAGCSTKEILHYGMGVTSGYFRQYDYGIFENFRRYHSIYPPAYNLSNVKTPISIYNGLNDYLADLMDVAKLASQLTNIVSMYTIKLEKLNHFDFLYGIGIREMVYNQMLKEILNYVNQQN